MGGGLVAGGEDAGAFERDIDAELAVRQRRRVLDGRHPDRPATRVDRIALDLDRMGEPAVDAVEAEQMRIGLDGSEIIDGHDFDVGPSRLDDGPQDIAADPPEAVDGDLHRHGHSPWLIGRRAKLTGPGLARRLIRPLRRAASALMSKQL